MKPLIIYVTTSDREEAAEIAERLVEDRLAACCTILGEVGSVYRWEGKVERSSEVLLMIKTMSTCYLKLEARVLELHSYDTPEIIAVELFAGNRDYLVWMQEETQ